MLSEETKMIIKYVKYGVLSIFTLIVVSSGFFTVSQGNVALMKTFGKMSDTTFEPGLHWKIPLITSVIKLNVQTQKDEVVATAASKDLQNVNAVIAVNYNIDGAKAKQIYTSVGTVDSLQSKIISPSIQEVVKSVTANYTAEELIKLRPSVTKDIMSGLNSKLSQYNLTVIDVNIVDFKFSANFDASIEAKVKAEQDALAQKNLLEKVKYEAQQQIETAKAQAETIKIQAEAINKQGGAEYVQLKWIEKWNGQLPSTQLGSNATPMINLVK